MNNEEAVKTALELIGKSGAEAGEVFLSESRDTKIIVRDAKMESLEFGNERGIGVRILLYERIGFSFTTNFTVKNLERVVKEAISNSCFTLRDPANGFPQSLKRKIPSVFCYDFHQEKVTLEEKIEMAKTIEDSAKRYDSRIKAFKETSFGDEIRQILY